MIGGVDDNPVVPPKGRLHFAVASSVVANFATFTDHNSLFTTSHFSEQFSNTAP
jgi:hypothetical protein